MNYELDLRGERCGVCCLLSSAGAGRRLFSATDTEEVGDGEGDTDADGSVQKESGRTMEWAFKVAILKCNFISEFPIENLS